MRARRLTLQEDAQAGREIGLRAPDRWKRGWEDLAGWCRDWVELPLAFQEETISLPGFTHPKGSESRTSGRPVAGEWRRAQRP